MYLDIACRACLILVFAVAVIGKVRGRAAYREFATSLRPLGAEKLAGAVVAAEIATVVLLCVPMVGWGYVLATGLLGVFIAGIVQVIRSRQPVACNCFGAGGRQLGRPHLVRNGLLVCVAVAGFVAGQFSELSAGAPAILAIAAAGGAVVSAVFIRWDDIAYLLAE